MTGLQLAHFSVKEYLTLDRLKTDTARFFDEGVAKAQIKKVCLAYLSHFDEQCWISEIRVDFPLAQYSARYWMDHARPVENEKDVREHILDFFQQRQAYEVWDKLFKPDRPWDKKPHQHGNMASPLYYSSLAS